MLQSLKPPTNEFVYFLLLVLPSAPKNVSITFVNQSAVEIRWQPPAITGDLSHVSYDVDCRKSCGGDDDKCEEACGSYVSYKPNKESLKVTQVIIINLSSFVNYTFLINAMNRASEVAKRKHGVEGNFTTITVRTKGSSKLWRFKMRELCHNVKSCLPF